MRWMAKWLVLMAKPIGISPLAIETCFLLFNLFKGVFLL